MPGGGKELMKQILVTGGAGLIGSHLCEALIAQGHYVVCMDNFSTGKPEHILALLEHPNFLLIRQDVTTPLSLEIGIDEIYHLACPASPDFYQKDPVATIRTNVTGTLNVLEFARTKSARLVFSSTSEVYGDPLEHPQSESYNGNVNPIGIRACYDEGKRSAEALCFSYNRQYGTKFKVVRIFNTYGPHLAANDGRVISNFIVQALENKPITIYGDGLQTRCFCYVEDTIKGLMGMMATPEEICGPVNLGTTAETTMLELANKVIELTESSSELAFYPRPQDDPSRRRPNLKRAQEILDWAPSVSLDEGIKRTIPYFKRPLISIIVPVYNCEQYLKECVDSILAQSLEDFELILVNDGSTDSSGRICDDYAEKDPRVLVIHKENGGVSSSRSAGFCRSKGQYIGFVDSDDILHPDMYQSLLDLLEKHHADISCCGFWQFNDGSDTAPPASGDVEQNDFKMSGKEAARHLYTKKGVTSRTTIFLWNKLYKRFLFSELEYWNKKSDFPQLYFDDSFLTPQLCFYAESMVFTTKKLYGYRQRISSLKRDRFCSHKFEQPEIRAFLSDVFYKKGALELSKILLKSQAVELLRLWMESYSRSGDKEAKALAMDVLKEFRGIYPKLQRQTKQVPLKFIFFIFRYMPRVLFFVFRRYYFSHFSGYSFRKGIQKVYTRDLFNRT